MRRLAWAAILGVALGCVGAAALSMTGVDDAQAGPPREGWPPDPPAKASTRHWVFEIQVKKGEIVLGKVSPVDLEKAEATPRVMGRYALELWVGKELLDRVRFNVPLGGDGPPEPDRPGMKRPEFRVSTRFFARMAENPRATQLRLVDRATGDVRVFSWPVGSGGVTEIREGAPTADAGKPDAGKPDAGKPDAGSPDAGDAGSADAGDAQPPRVYDPVEP
jgi:hypothetical protein